MYVCKLHDLSVTMEIDLILGNLSSLSIFVVFLSISNFLTNLSPWLFVFDVSYSAIGTFRTINLHGYPF